ncbi:MAG: peptidoglycan-binding domain-containing protein [Candidatus Nomurabacteria bacterium]|nr:peptidoglycan-binding domain-containing protein [Candidatus Nomurabacteria bacterium]
MKKIILGLFLFGFLFVGSQAFAENTLTSFPVIISSNTLICPPNMPNPLALCSDGRIEAATKDANNCTTSWRCTNPRNDLGCINHEIYSTFTKQLCPIINIDSGCTSTSKYSSTTGQACLGKIPEVDGGCNGINKYSLMTGKLCSNFTGIYTPVIPVTIDIPITRTLKLGIKGDDVRALQAFLNLLADGSFGPKTQAKVMEWQAAHDLTADGSFGRMSREKAGLNQ